MILEAEVIKEKPKPAPEKKGLITVIKLSSSLSQIKMFAFSKHAYVVIIAEAEVIKEKVKPAPVKKGMDI